MRGGSRLFVAEEFLAEEKLPRVAAHIVKPVLMGNRQTISSSYPEIEVLATKVALQLKYQSVDVAVGIRSLAIASAKYDSGIEAQVARTGNAISAPA